jgi:hypothetical protein
MYQYICVHASTVKLDQENKLSIMLLIKQINRLCVKNCIVATYYESHNVSFFQKEI